jgi:hypothetical protein
MKIKLICSVIATAAVLAASAQAIGQETPLDALSAGMVSRTYTGKSAKPFFKAFVAKLQQNAKSGDTVMGKGAASYLAQLEAGGYTSYIHQTARPIAEKELQTGIQPENHNDPALIAGQTTTDQTCQKNANNTFTVTGITFVAEADSKGTLAWATQRFFTSIKASCPDIIIPTKPE